MVRRLSNRERIRKMAEEAAARAKERKAGKKRVPSSRSSKNLKKPRMRAIWGVFNNAYRLVSSFPYNSKADAEAKASELARENKSTYIVELVKKPME